MTTSHLDMELLLSMRSKKLQNYAIAGLDSSIIGGGDQGCVRLFEMTRNQTNEITAHSHRFDFQCIVLHGHVVNKIWMPCREDDPEADLFKETLLTYCGEPGKYKAEVKGWTFYRLVETEYFKGDLYSMKAEEIHSINFSKGTKVLFLEGPNLVDTSIILEPVVAGKVVGTFKVEDWMFQKG